MASTTPTVVRGAPSPSIAQLGFRRTFSALSIPEYRILWWGMIASWAALQMSMVARGYLAYDLTGSATALGIVSVAGGLPMLLFALIGGVIVDRAKKRGVLVWSQTALGLLTLAHAVLIHTGLIEIWQLLALGLAQGAIFSFNMPARSAIVPEIVGPHQLTNALALNNAGMNFSRVLGPVTAGALIGVPFIGMAGVFYLMAALYIVVVWSLLKLSPGKMPDRIPGTMLSEMTSGLRYIKTNQVLFLLLSMAFIPILLGMAYQMLLPVFQKDVLHVGSFGLGMLYGAVGVGALIGSLIVAFYSESKARGRMQSAAGLLFGATLIGFALMQSLPLALIMVAGVGLASSSYMALNSSMIMSHTDEAYYGRVMSVYMMTFGLMPLAVLPAGILVDVVGAPATIAGCGALIIAFVGGLLLLFPAYRRIE